MSASLIGRLGSSAFRLFHDCGVDVARGLVLLSGLGTRGPSIMGFEDEVEQSLPRPCCWQVQADIRTHLIHRPARDTIPPLGGARSFLLSHLILSDPHAVAVSLVHLNSVPSIQMRCMITAKRRASATIAFFIPRCLAIFIAQALSHDHLAEQNSMAWAAS